MSFNSGNQKVENGTLDGDQENGYSKDLNTNDNISFKNDPLAEPRCSTNLETEKAKSSDSNDRGQKILVSDVCSDMLFDKNYRDTLMLEEDSIDVSSGKNSNSQPNETDLQQLQRFHFERPSFSTIQNINGSQAGNLRHDCANHERTPWCDNFYDHTTSDSDSDGDSGNSWHSMDQKSQDVLQRKMKRLESMFRKRYSIDFDEYSMNPCKIPNLNYKSNETASDEVLAKKFESWLSTSPFRIWFTKHSGNKLYAQCKYDHCRKTFSFSRNRNSSGMVKHLETNHSSDYEKFNSQINSKQNELTNTDNFGFEARKPFKFCTSFIDFYKSKPIVIKELDFFVENLLPFNSVESQSFRDLIGLVSGNNKRPFIFSRKSMIKELTNYHDQFEKQLRFTLKRTSKINIQLDIWTSGLNKSYLAILVSFCPNLDRLDQKSQRNDVIGRGSPTPHVIGFHDISGPRYTGEYLSQVFVDSLDQHSLKHKVASVTIGNAAQNLTMLDRIEFELTGEGVNAEGGIVRIHCLQDVLNLIFRHIVERFEKQNAELIGRIDELTSKIEHNVFLSDHFKTYAGRAVPKHNETRFVSRHKQWSSFMNLGNSLKQFYSNYYTYRKFQLEKEDRRLFVYEPEEIFSLELFLKLTNLFLELTTDVQDDAMNNLPNGIQFYTLLHRYFEACSQISMGNNSDENLKIAGIQFNDLVVVSEENKSKILSTIIESRSLFERYYNLASAQMGYWVAHILRPDMKIRSLSKILDRGTEAHIISKASNYVYCYLGCHYPGRSTKFAYPDAGSSCSNKQKRPRRKLRAFDRFSKALRNTSFEREAFFEWECYNREPLDLHRDFITYWMANRGRFPRLSSLALSFYYTRLSTGDVERSFSIRKKAIEGRFSLSSGNLERMIVLRNRLKCFGFREKLKHITSIEDTSWAEEDMSNGSSDDQNSFSDQDSYSE
ncbi:putative transposase of the Rover hAT-like DNA transposon [Lachancea lanzarotensis]|uniref:LALA0S07e04258g1_1 n=1 Tax=Lachancea lanzarotensis TaxID=1245769 RepID=A0A0C7MZH1_9SACH|nr:putative transposase of the Rover hAT-like DNA transposon [Lachancea lanzarotensis]CEP63182.1 putative transposase of the Rover hAT-like DNA transposon [Lachancea lanzarotensis]